MAVTPTPIYPQTLKNYIMSFAPADTTTAKIVVTPGLNGCKLLGLLVQSTDTADRDIVLSVLIASVNYNLATIKIPLNSGNTNALPNVDLFHLAQFPGLSIDAVGNRYMDLAFGTQLQIAMGTTITAAKQVNVFGWGADF